MNFWEDKRGNLPLLLLLLAAGAGLLCLWGVVLWLWPHPISGRGGIPIPGRLLIALPRFAQGDSRWSGDHLAETPGTLGREGCAVSSAAMVLAGAGADTDPGRLNRFLLSQGGYEGRGWLRWESAGLYPGAELEKAYEDLPSYALIDGNLLRGNPVIVRLRRPDGITHFVVIVGKQGIDYLVRDPAGAPEDQEIHAFSECGVPIEALRFYHRMASLKGRGA